MKFFRSRRWQICDVRLPEMPGHKRKHHAKPESGAALCAPAHAVCDKLQPRRPKHSAHTYQSVPVPPSLPVPPPPPPNTRPLPPLEGTVTMFAPTSWDDSATRACGLMMTAWARPDAYFGSLAGYARPLRYASVGAMLLAPLLLPFALVTDSVLWWHTRGGAVQGSKAH